MDSCVLESAPFALRERKISTAAKLCATEEEDLRCTDLRCTAAASADLEARRTNASTPKQKALE